MTVATPLPYTRRGSSSNVGDSSSSHQHHRPDGNGVGIDERDDERQLEHDLGVESDVARLRDQPAVEPDLGDEETADQGQEEEDDEDDLLPFDANLQASLYYDASTMASLNPISVVRPNNPFLPLVVTMRAASLRSFSGHAALPGGKADSADETPYQIARREAFEEIGLPMDDLRIPKPFRIEPLCVLPPSLARTHLVVTPCVAFLHADRSLDGSSASSSSSGADSAAEREGEAPLVEESLIPRLDAREVAAVFSAPFYNFLKIADLPQPPGSRPLPPGHWYDGAWIAFKDMPWRVHNFYVPVNNQRVSKPRRRSSASAHGNLADALDQQQEFEGRFKVWGMTGRVLVDAARVAYAEEPEMEHNETFGDYDIIQRAFEEGAFENTTGQDKADATKSHKM
ncbi:hypothetical protein HIM_06989 [Hirsutella minnesotensis 3608]|uniref:Nudix hydrolase domain-containing protein n=1 Tax=Hirsutella minnesotensis 3608 TaxID=1043627 RepID=A0A0F7ZIF7_9HYPO|nr:hypothetical protein HIM_06989 [Hirsutella minnesotensis 3608]